MSLQINVDHTIPVLTEIISLDNLTEAAVLQMPPQAPPLAIPQQAEITPAFSFSSTSANPPITSPSADPELSEEWEKLEKIIYENVLKHILTRVDFVLEHRVRDSLADALQNAVENLTSEIRLGLTHSLHDVITRAINQEISKVQSSRF